MTLEMIDAENDLKVALDRYNQICMGMSDEGMLVETREQQLEMIEMSAQTVIQSYKN